MIGLIAALLFLIQPAPPPFTATWDGPGAATISWSQSARSCLSRQPRDGTEVPLDCYDAPGVYSITFGHVGPLDGRYRPAPGDTYVLVTNEGVFRAPLLHALSLPLVARESRPEMRRLWVPMIGR